MKDLTGKTTCPTLLNQRCRYCFTPGHTVKFCEALIKIQKEREVDERERKARATAKQPKTAVHRNQLQTANGFAILCDDSDTEEEVSNNIVINEIVPVKQEKELTGWAAIAAKPKEVKEVLQNPGLVFLTKPKPVQKPVQEPVVAPKPAPCAVLTKSWADLSDSDDDDYYYRSQTSLAKEQIDDDEDW